MPEGSFYLVLKEARGYGLTARIHGTRKPPTVHPGEVAIKLNVTLPAGLFKRPQIVASLNVKDEVAPFKIDAAMQDNIASVLSEQLGINVTVTAPEVPDSR